MTKRGLLIAGVLGLLLTIVAAILIRQAAANTTIDVIVLVLDLVAAGIAGRVTLGRVRVHRYYSLGIVVFSAVAAIILTTAVSNYLIHISVSFGPIDYAPTTAIVIEAIVGFVAYLIAATIYGFAGTRQGVTVGERIGLLLLLLLAVVPIANVLGLIGLTITAGVRGGATPARPAVSE